MAAVKIRVGGSKAKPADKPEPKTRKTGAKATTRPTTRGKRGAAAKPKTTPAKRGPGRPRKAEGEPVQRRTSKNIDARTEAKFVKLVEKAGARRQKAKIEHEESVNALHAAAQEALEAGVSMALVADASGISRQWLYKMGDFRQDERGGHQLRATTANGNSDDAKPAANTRSTRKVSAKPAAKRTTTRRNTKVTSASSKPRPRSRTRIRAS